MLFCPSICWSVYHVDDMRMIRDYFDDHDDQLWSWQRGGPAMINNYNYDEDDWFSSLNGLGLSIVKLI